MNTHGQSTSAVARSITPEMNNRGYDVFYDHDKAGEFVGTIAVSIEEELSREKEISQLDIAVVDRKLNKLIALVEIEETTDNPKKLIGDIFAVLMGKSIYPPRREKVEIGKWTTLIIIGKGAGHEARNKRIQELAINAKSVLETANSSIGNIVIVSVSDNDNLKKALMEQINEAIRRIA